MKPFDPGTSEVTSFRMPGLLGAFAVIWALYFAITEAPVAIKHDMAEAYAWGQEFQLGYNQHPPFWAWICGLWFAVLPRTGWAFALLSSVNAAIGLGGAWMVIGDFASGRKRMAAWILLLLTPLYTFYAYKYDANIIFLSIWPWTLHFFMRSIQRGGSGDAVMLGVCAGLALMSKYYAAILIATCLLAALQHPSRRRFFASASPCVAAGIALAVCAPHIVWLIAYRAPPLHYLAAVSDQGWDTVIAHAGRTLSDVLGMNLGVVILVAVARATRSNRTAALAPGMGGPMLRVLATLALAPLVLTIAAAVALRTDVTSEMTVGTFALLPLLIIEIAGIRDAERLYRIGARLAAVVTFGALLLSPVIALARTYLSSNAMNTAPYQEVALQATKIWRDRTGLPLRYVSGSAWYENAIAFYSPDRPHVFVHFEHRLSLWVSSDDIAKQGLLSVCLSADHDCLAATAAFATPATTRTELSLAHMFWGHVGKPIGFVITVIPPRG